MKAGFRPIAEVNQQATEILVRELSLVLTGKKSSKEALDTAAQEMSKLLGACAPMKYPVK